SYFPGNAGLWYEILLDGKKVAESDENTLSRLSRVYENGLKKKICSELGFTYHYDANKEDGWKTGSLDGFTNSVLTEAMQPLPRPVKRLEILPFRKGELIKNEKSYLFDLGEEEVGYLKFRIFSSKKQRINIAFGEHIKDGGVRRFYEHRDFSYEVTLREGITEFANYMRRIGARYLEITSEDEIQVEYIGLVPCAYPLKKVQKDFGNDLRNKIYEVGMRTLELCIHDHIEDCPSREQGLYTMDSRNQMLCGYYAFEEFEMPRACLLLISKDNQRDDNLLPTCAPEKADLCIPSFVLHYFRQLYEYAVYSKDTSLIKEVMPRIKLMIDTFLGNMKDGLVMTFKGKRFWNFYEWKRELKCADETETHIKVHTEDEFEAPLNCLLSMALDFMQKMCDMIGEKADYLSIKEEIDRKTFERFYNKEKGLFVIRDGKEEYSELVNAFAILCGAAKGEIAEKIAEKLASDNDMVPCTLSMRCFKYDALLSINKEKYKDYILCDIDEKYKKMLDADATTFWETELGADDINAGSLCHGWSAMPVYYYNILL
ncbi:MAG: family 78 glycoside hydrolase catalytic domain, partial [Clostridia bacterium]|nr:family 78 glycoside hydrolase catalytic domain [Clostridia bacterium]